MEEGDRTTFSYFHNFWGAERTPSLSSPWAVPLLPAPSSAEGQAPLGSVSMLFGEQHSGGCQKG